MIVTVFPFPAFVVLTFPLFETVAYSGLELVHVKVLLAFFPVVVTVAFTFRLFPALTVLEAADNLIFLTESLVILIVWCGAINQIKVKKYVESLKEYHGNLL